LFDGVDDLRTNYEDLFWSNLNRLAVIVIFLVSLRLFTYFIQEFLPVFGEVLKNLFVAFFPFILALVIAHLLEPLVAQLIRILHLKRGYAALLSLIIALGLLSLIAFLVITRLYTELSELAVSLPNYSYIMDFAYARISALQEYLTLNPQIQSTLFSSTESILKSVQDWAKSGSIFLLNFLSALPGAFVIFVVSIVATLLMSISFPNVKNFMNRIVPRRWQENAKTVSQELGVVLVGFLRAEIILVSVTMLITIFGLMLIGNRYAVTIGVFAGLLDIFPIVGTGILFVPWIIILLIYGSLSAGIKILVIWVLAVVVRQALEPKVMSQNIGLHPLPTLVSMYVGLKLLGGAGLVLGPTIVIIYEAIRKSFLLNKQNKQTSRPDEPQEFQGGDCQV
jgi:sporulation integral membrane protein YtvI